MPLSAASRAYGTHFAVDNIDALHTATSVVDLRNNDPL
jgi:hypothetical protein